jgi:uncharacterized delta-60 repeat protein
MPTSARSAAALVAALLVGLVVPAAAQAAPGDLDPSFSGDGKQTTDFVGFSWARATVLQPDGKIVAVGQDAVPGVDFALARYNPNGSLDPTFSGDGRGSASGRATTQRPGSRSSKTARSSWSASRNMTRAQAPARPSR